MQDTTDTPSIVWAGGIVQNQAGAPPPAPGSALDGITTQAILPLAPVTPSTNQQHVHYVGLDNHVHELFYTNQWIFNDLTQLAFGPNVAVGTALDAYESPWNAQQHVDAMGTDGVAARAVCRELHRTG
jgi:hypothetical protein